MKSRNRVAVLMFLLIVLWGGAAAATFVLVGSQLAVYVAGSIVPLLIVFAVVWSRSVVGGGGSGEAKIAKQQARKVGSEFEEFWHSYQSTTDRFPDHFEEYPLQVDHVLSKLDNNDVSFDRETGSAELQRVSIFSGPDIEQLKAISAEIDDLEQQLETEAETAARNTLEQWEHDLERIADLLEGTPSIGTGIEADQFGSMPELFVKVDETEAEVRDRIETAIDELRSVSTTSTADLDDAAAALQEDNYRLAVDKLVTAKQSMESAGRGELLERRRSLLELIETIEETDVSASGELQAAIDSFESYRSDLQSLEELTDISELDSIERELQTDAIDLLRKQLGVVSLARETLQDESIPSKFIAMPPPVEQRLVDDLETIDSTDEFVDEFKQSFALLVDRLNTLYPKSEVADVYASVEPRIDDQLAEHGSVEPEDVPVQEHQSEFLRLYALDNEQARFDEDTDVLLFGGEDSIHQLSVMITLDPELEETRITVSVEGERYGRSKSQPVDDLGKVIFDSVPAGDYDLRIEPDASFVEHDVQSVTIDDDQSVSADLSGRPEVRSLCSGFNDPGALLDELDDEIANRYESNGVLTTEMEFPVDEEAIGCLLAQWGMETGRDVSIDDGRVVVHDRETLLEELRRVAKHNLDTYERVGYDELRDRYLSSAVPDWTIAKATEELSDLMVTDGELQKLE